MNREFSLSTQLPGPGSSPVEREGRPRGILATIFSFLQNFKIQRREKRLRLCETLPLGDKRMLAVVQFEQRRFLVGVTSRSISLLDKLDSGRSESPTEQEETDLLISGGVH